MGILGSKVLNVGRLAERIDVETMGADVLGIGPDRQVTFRKMTQPMLFAQACCLADIPIIHLGHHATRYGKIAIGYHRDAVVDAGFSPVFYQLPNAPAAKCLIEALNLIDTVSGFFPVHTARHGGAIETDSKSDSGHPDRTIDSLNAGSLTRARECLARAVCYIKTFERNEFGAIYTEREWRSVEPFKFEYADIAMIVAPRKGGYFDRFVADAEKHLKLPRSTPIVPWEDLIEH
jgi:hypothetical protein